MRMLARNLSCPNMSWCEDFKCYKGHVCGHDLRGSCQKGRECYFVEVHGIDSVSPLESLDEPFLTAVQKPAFKVYEDGRQEAL
jgi:hypothetical protein